MVSIDRPTGAVQQMELFEAVRIAKLLLVINNHPAACLSEAVEWIRQAHREHRDALNLNRWRQQVPGSLSTLVKELTGCDAAAAQAAEQAALGGSKNAITIRTLKDYCKAHQISVPGVCR